MAAMKPKVLVLGAGQVGTFAARCFAEDGAEVLAGDLEPATGFFTRFGPPGGELVAVDICDIAALRRLIGHRGIDVVVLTAGLAARTCAEDRARAMRLNAHGPAVVADAVRSAGARRLVFVSSFAVYGRMSAGPIHETTPFAPATAYGRSKCTAERRLARAARQGLDVRVIRPCGIYGPSRPGSGSYSTRLVDRLLVATLQGDSRPQPLANCGADEYMYVKDGARALARVALHEGAAASTFNVGSGTVVDPHALSRAIAAGARCREVALEPPTRRGADSPRFPLDTSRIRAAIGFEPRYDLIGGIRDYLETAIAL